MTTAQASEMDRQRVTLTGELADVQFLAGRSATVNATVSDDVFAAGLGAASGEIWQRPR